MSNLLETDRRRFMVEPQPGHRRWLSRRGRWIAGVTAGLLFASALGYVIADEVQAHEQFDHAQTSLGVTRQQTRTVSTELAGLGRELNVLTAQAGNASTALNQYGSQLTGARAALAAAQAHVTQQATHITSLQTCLGGIERALNALSVGDRSSAIADLQTVSTSCSAAAGSSG